MRMIATPVILLVMLQCVQAQTHTETDSLPKGWWHFPKTPVRFKVGGYLKADLIHDFNPIASPDFFDVTKIPTDGSTGQSTHFNLKETRLLMDVRTPTKVGDIRAYVEGDFYGSGASFRIRHAFVDIADKWLFGQWWSNFMDEDIIPNTLDFEKPGGYPFIRHGMLRYKAKLSSKSYLALAVEEPSVNATAPADPGKFLSPLPDLTARFRYFGKWGHLQLTSFVAFLQYQYESGGEDKLTLFGANLSGKFNVFKHDYFNFQVVGGPGSGRYRSGLSAAPDANQELQPLDDFGYTVSYCHYWTSALSTLVVYNSGNVGNNAGQSSNSLKNVKYVAANLLWQFTPTTMAGMEYMWGKRTDKNDASGTANRIQFSIKQSFNL
jgi:DcaP outer membrane protein